MMVSETNTSLVLLRKSGWLASAGWVVLCIAIVQWIGLQLRAATAKKKVKPQATVTVTASVYVAVIYVT